MRLNITYVKSKMTYITGMCLRKSFNVLRGREGCWLYGVYEIDINHTSYIHSNAGPGSLGGRRAAGPVFNVGTSWARRRCAI